MPPLPSNLFRPCIDLYQGQVKQIVGSSLTDQMTSKTIENFTSSQPASYYAHLYQQNQLYGGHLIMLGNHEANFLQAEQALKRFPQGLHVGGGMNLKNTQKWLDLGAEKIIYTSYLFPEGRLSQTRLALLKKKLGPKRTVIDLSCYSQAGTYYIASKGWQNRTSFQLNRDNLKLLGEYGSEFLIHAIDLEGKKQGIDHRLIDLLAQHSPIDSVYAGGIHSYQDIAFIVEKNQTSQNRIAFTVGSALDLFGGQLSFKRVIELGRETSSS